MSPFIKMLKVKTCLYFTRMKIYELVTVVGWLVAAVFDTSCHVEHCTVRITEDLLRSPAGPPLLCKGPITPRRFAPAAAAPKPS